MYQHISPTNRVSLEGIEPSPHGVRIRHAANKHLKLEDQDAVVAAGFEPAPHRLKAGPLPIELRHPRVLCSRAREARLPSRVGGVSFEFTSTEGGGACRPLRQWARSESNALANGPAFTAQVAFRGRTPSPETAATPRAKDSSEECLPRAAVVLARTSSWARSAPFLAMNFQGAAPKGTRVRAASRRRVRGFSRVERVLVRCSVPGAGFEPTFLSPELSVLPTRRSRNSAWSVHRYGGAPRYSSETKLDVLHGYLPPNAPKATERCFSMAFEGTREVARDAK
jgi:hypothetical protein